MGSHWEEPLHHQSLCLSLSLPRPTVSLGCWNELLQNTSLAIARPGHNLQWLPNTLTNFMGLAKHPRTSPGALSSFPFSSTEPYHPTPARTLACISLYLEGFFPTPGHDLTRCIISIFRKPPQVAVPSSHLCLISLCLSHKTGLSFRAKSQAQVPTEASLGV